MKKFITLSAIFALSVATVAEAKGGRSGGSRSFSSSRAVATQPVMSQQQANSYAKQNTQKDATFANTPNRSTQNQTQASGSNRLASFATGAAAGYVLSEMLAPTPAQAAPATATTTETTQPVENSQNIANAAPTTTVAQFKSIGGQVDPFLIEKTDGYRRYCISGVQYLASAMPSQGSPIVMVNPNGTPLTCNLIP